MEKARRVFVDADFAFQQPAVVAVADVACSRMIGNGSGQQQAHINPFSGGTLQSSAYTPGGDKVGRGKPDAVSGALQVFE